jgi:hypothetical protein
VARALPGSAAAAASRELLSVVVSSYACSDPPQLSAALAAIRDAKEQALAVGEVQHSITPCLYSRPPAVNRSKPPSTDPCNTRHLLTPPSPRLYMPIISTKAWAVSLLWLCRMQAPQGQAPLQMAPLSER